MKSDFTIVARQRDAGHQTWQRAKVYLLGDPEREGIHFKLSVHKTTINLYTVFHPYQ